MEELGWRIFLAEALAEAGGQRPSELRRAVGGHRDDRAEHGDGPARALPAPAVGHRLGRGELPCVHELDIRAQDRVLGERDRVVRPRAVDHRRRDEHEVVGVAGDRLGKRLVDAFGDVLPTAGPRVVIAGAEMHDDVDLRRLGRGGCLGDGDRAVGLEQAHHTSAEVSFGAADRHADRRGTHAVAALTSVTVSGTATRLGLAATPGASA